MQLLFSGISPHTSTHTMAGTVHKVTYGLAALAALLHLIFAAIAANDAKVATDINDSNAAALKSIGGVIEPDTSKTGHQDHVR